MAIDRFTLHSLYDQLKPNLISYSWIAVILVISLVILILFTNLNFTIIKSYLMKNPESKNRLLNVLHWLQASILQFGSVLIFLILAEKFNDKLLNLNLLIPSKEFCIQISMLHLSCVFLNIFSIGIATVIHSFKKNMYLQIGQKFTKNIIFMTTLLLSILINIFVKITSKEDENDGKLVRYQTVIQTVGLCLSLSSVLMFLSVLLIPHFVKLFECAGKYCHYSQSRVSPSVEEMETNTIEMSEVTARAESDNGEDAGNPLPDIKECIR